MKTAVVTLCIDENDIGWEGMSNTTHPIIKGYSDRIKSDFILINLPQVNAKDVGFEKCQLGNLLQYYDRIIYFDTDIIITKDCPNLFDIVPERDLGAFIESEYSFYSDEVRHTIRIRRTQEKLGEIGWVKDYFNTGVMVLSKKHAPMFELAGNYIVDLREQTQLNYNCRKLGFWVHDIGIRLNKMDFINPFDRYEAYVIHYAGKGFTPVFHDINLKNQVIREDIEILKNLGNI